MSKTATSRAGNPELSSVTSTPSQSPASPPSQSGPSLPPVVEALNAIPKFSDKLEKALSDTFPDLYKNDPMCGAEFDPVTFINERFPDEASLKGSKLDDTLGVLQRDLVLLNEKITTDVQRQAEQRNQVRVAVGSAAGSIQLLFGKVREIRARAAQSEQMVEAVCRDMTVLDRAKRNLRQTISAVRNLHMLVSTVSLVKKCKDKHQYAAAARWVTAAEDLFTLFKDYRDTPKIKSIRNQFDALCDSLLALVMAELRVHLLSPTPSLVDLQTNLQSLQGCCAALDALPVVHKKDFTRRFVNLRLAPHETMFGERGAESGIEHVGRRIAWFKRTSKELETTFKDIFPAHWRIWAVLADAFCLQARKHISVQLNQLFNSLVSAQNPTAEKLPDPSKRKNSPAGTGNDEGKSKDGGSEEKESRELVALLSASFIPIPSEADMAKFVVSMQEVLQFERELKSKFSDCAPPVSVASPEHKDHSNDDEYVDSTGVKATSASEVRAKYRNSPAGSNHTEKDESNSDANKSASSPYPKVIIDFTHAISVAYLPYLCLLVANDQKILSELVSKFSREEKWSGAFGSEVHKYPLDVRYDSSNVLLLTIKRSMDRCVRLSNGHALGKLVDVYIDTLKEYADLMMNKIMQYVFNIGIELDTEISPKAAPVASSVNSSYFAPSNSPSSTISPSAQRERDEALRCFCLIIKTGDYMCGAARDMLEHINSKIHRKLTVTDSHVQSVEDAFNEVVGKARTAVVSTVLSQLSDIISTHMLTTPWATLSMTGDQSDYVGYTQTRIQRDMAVIHVLLSASPVYHASVCTSIATNFLRMMYEAVYKCHRFSTVGAAQLAVDVYALRSTVLSIPQIRSQTDSGAPFVDVREPVPASFTRQVRREAQKLDSIAKVLGSSARTLVSTYSTLIAKPSVQDFQKVMDLIGLTKEDANECVREFRETNPAAAAAADAELLERAGGSNVSNEANASISPTNSSTSPQGAKSTFGRFIDKLMK